MKPQKSTKQRRQLSQGLPAIQNNGFNQTIIINNPNFNINYIDHTAYNPKPNSRQINNKNIQQLPVYDQKNSSKGIDAWSFNKNLKEFSQTRQLGFFKGNGVKTKSNSDLQNSPYLSHKTRTQDIKSYNKIKPNGIIQASAFRQNRTIPTIKHQTLIAAPARDRSALSNNPPSLDPDTPQQSKATFRKRKFQSKSKYQRAENLQTLQPYLRTHIQLSQTIPNTQRKINPIALTTRRNRFVDIEKPNLTKPVHKSYQENDQQGDLSDLQNSLILADTSPRKAKTSNDNALKYNKPKNKHIEKSIQKISKCFLSKVDNFLDQVRTLQITSSKIQVYATTAHQPTSYSYNIDYKSTAIIQQADTGYDFQFEDEKQKTRPKTPYKRKKMYQQIN